MTDLRRILLVEDNPHDIELTLRALAKYNLANAIVVVRDGEEALDYLYCRAGFAGRASGHPAMILLDIKLPRLNGLAVLKQIRSEPDLKSLPVVMLTASREEPDLAESYRLGANAYVVKPLDFLSFVEAVKRLGVSWALMNEPPAGDPGSPDSL